MLRKTGLAVVAVLAVSGCAKPVWNKPGASQSDFAQDKYACLQQSQQQVSGIYVNRFAGVADSRMQANEGLFASCMNAKGWYLKQATSSPPGAIGVPPINHIKEAQDIANREGDELCKRADLQVYFAKAACKASDITLEQMADTSKVTPEQKEALSKLPSLNNAINVKLHDAFLRYGGATGAKVVAARERAIQDSRDSQLKLFEGKMTWGEYNKYRYEHSNAYRQEYLSIVQGK
jgi:hypothetical protein